jgi:hypothetical protein
MVPHAALHPYVAAVDLEQARCCIRTYGGCGAHDACESCDYARALKHHARELYFGSSLYIVLLRSVEAIYICIPKWETQQATPALACDVMETVRKASSLFSFYSIEF